MCPHRRKCDDRRDIREGILKALRGMALPMCIRHPEARGCSGFVRLAYIPVRSMSGPLEGLFAPLAGFLSDLSLAGGNADEVDPPAPGLATEDHAGRRA